MPDVKLDLGAGDLRIPGFTPIDIKQGQRVYPLEYEDGSVDEIRASHVLEHFSFRDTVNVLKDWIRALVPGGLLRVAVPDFDYIIKGYQEGSEEPLEAYVLGGHVDAHDQHGAIFNREKLQLLLQLAGLETIEPWKSELQDCASLPVSLNLQGRKPIPGVQPKPALVPVRAPMPTPAAKRPAMRVCAVMSMPRLCFVDNLFCAMQAFIPLGIPLKRHTGVFWGQCLTKCMEESIEEGFQYVITLDYDTIFTTEDVVYLIQALDEHPEMDAVSSAHLKREDCSILATMRTSEGELRDRVSLSEFEKDFTQIASAHFGLTVFRTAKLKALPRPWFLAEPDPEGRWGEGRLDEDLAFWKRWKEAGFSLYQANRIRLGHLELMVTWPGKQFQPVYQHINQYHRDGRPKEVEG